jgi:hypothetical protein
MRDLLDRIGTVQQYPDSRFFKVKVFLRDFGIFLYSHLNEPKLQKIRRKSILYDRNKFQGEVLLLGNGPSIDSIKIEQIKYFRKSGGKIANVNSFVLDSRINVLEPDFYFLTDPLFWDKDKNSQLILNLKIYLQKNPNCILVQPTNKEKVIESHSSYSYIDVRPSILKKKSKMNVFSRNNLSYSVILSAIMALKNFGFNRIYFAGIESDIYKHIYVDELNRLILQNSFYLGITSNKSTKEMLQSQDGEPTRSNPLRDMRDALYASAHFLNDFRIVSKGCINVGNDKSNDTCPRATLLTMESNFGAR